MSRFKLAEVCLCRLWSSWQVLVSAWVLHACLGASFRVRSALQEDVRRKTMLTPTQALLLPLCLAGTEVWLSVGISRFKTIWHEGTNRLVWFGDLGSGLHVNHVQFVAALCTWVRFGSEPCMRCEADVLCLRCFSEYQNPPPFSCSYIALPEFWMPSGPGIFATMLFLLAILFLHGKDRGCLILRLGEVVVGGVLRCVETNLGSSCEETKEMRR